MANMMMRSTSVGWIGVAAASALIGLTGCQQGEETTSSLELGLGAGPVDQEQQVHPSVDGGLHCTSGAGGLAQGVTPGLSAWQTVSLFLFTADGFPGPEPASLELRDGAPDGPVIASASGEVPGRMGGWVDFVFDPPVSVTPGASVYLFTPVDARYAWAWNRSGDLYPAGDAFGTCGGPLFELEGSDFTFITNGPDTTPGDSDGDGLPDEQDPDTIADAVAALPASSFAWAAIPEMIASRLEAIEEAIVAGRLSEARARLTNLRRQFDGCGTSPDSSDWVTNCDDQLAIRTLIDELLATL